MGPTLDSRIKHLDVGIIMLWTKFDDKVVEHNSLVE